MRTRAERLARLRVERGREAELEVEHEVVPRVADRGRRERGAPEVPDHDLHKQECCQ
jgi:hypothetical protein